MVVQGLPAPQRPNGRNRRRRMARPVRTLQAPGQPHLASPSNFIPAIKIGAPPTKESAPKKTMHKHAVVKASNIAKGGYAG